MAKVSIVKLSQNWIFVNGNPLFSLPYYLKQKETLKTAIFPKHLVRQKQNLPLGATDIQF